MSHNKCDTPGCKGTAVTHIVEIQGGKQVDKHYCASCTKKMQGDDLSGMKVHTPINELLTNFVMAHSGMAKELAGACDSCGITWAEFKQAGLLGCSKDYDVFEKDLTPLLQRAHEGAAHHIGKVPSRRAGGSITVRARVDSTRLRKELATALEREDYEAAAKLRDKIRKTEEAGPQ